jgi:hypothetical protein
MEIQKISIFIDVNQGDNIRPAVRVYSAHMSSHLSAEKLFGFCVGHLTLGAKHLAAHIRCG